MKHNQVSVRIAALQLVVLTHPLTQYVHNVQYLEKEPLPFLEWSLIHIHFIVNINEGLLTLMNQGGGNVCTHLRNLD